MKDSKYDQNSLLAFKDFYTFVKSYINKSKHELAELHALLIVSSRLLNMGNSIRFLLPANILQQYIDEYYFIELDVNPSNEEFEQRPISDGCIELFIGYNNSSGTFFKDNGTSVRYSSGIVGAHNLKNEIKVLSLESIPKMLNVASIVFKPEGFYKIFKIPSSKVYNDFFETDCVIGGDIRLLREQLEEAKGFYEKKKSIDLFLFKQLIKNEQTNYKIENGFNVAAYIWQNKGNVRMKQIITEFKVSERTLQRDVKIAYGLSPKELCKIARFNSHLNYITNRKTVNWSDMVSQFGYYDQNHLISEFKSATSITPNMYMKFKDKSIFKINSHLVILRDSSSSEIQKIMIAAPKGI
jgi:AraC-like DNA-binding protein